jgi:hypothetical protein
MTFVLWIAIALMLGGAGLLVAGTGPSALWIATITIGIALVGIDRRGRPHSFSS